MTDDAERARARRSYAFGGGSALAVFASTLVALIVAFPDPRGRGFLAWLLAFERQPWLLLASALFAGYAIGALVQAWVGAPPKKG